MYRKINGKTLTLICLDEKTKKEMKQICNELGLTLNDAFTIFAKKFCREKGIPFEVSVASPRPTVNVAQGSEVKSCNSEELFPTFDECVDENVGDEISSKTYATTEQGELVLPQEATTFETVDSDSSAYSADNGGIDIKKLLDDLGWGNDDCTDDNADDEIDIEIHDSNETTAIDDDLWQKISEAFSANAFGRKGATK